MSEQLVPALWATMLVHLDSDEQYRRACAALLSVRELVDGWAIVLDTKNSHASLVTQFMQRFKDFNIVCRERDWTDDFGAAYNANLELVRDVFRNDETPVWVLKLDADELLACESKDRMRKSICEAHAEGLKCLGMGVRAVDDTGRVLSTVRQKRLFELNDDVRYERPVHAVIKGIHPDFTGATIDGELVAWYGSRGDQIKKAQRAIKILHAELKADHVAGGDDTVLFWLQQSYYLAGDIKNAGVWARRCVDQCGDRPEYASAWVTYFLAARQLNEKHCRSIIEVAAEAYPNHPDIQWCLLLAQMEAYENAVLEPGLHAYAISYTAKHYARFGPAAVLLGFRKAPEEEQEEFSLLGADGRAL